MLGKRIAQHVAAVLLAGAGLCAAAAAVVATDPGTTAPQVRIEAAAAPSGTTTGTTSVNDITWGP
ncbi:hypothetical protein [Streptomyces sp. R44]|uniref:Uncharacterized protein n=1 Tax=Streptomyces sp. R44 TaxID=3238633 RepID=A0AB39T106_9ACTN